MISNRFRTWGVKDKSPEDHQLKSQTTCSQTTLRNRTEKEGSHVQGCRGQAKFENNTPLDCNGVADYCGKKLKGGHQRENNPVA